MIRKTRTILIFKYWDIYRNIRVKNRQRNDVEAKNLNYVFYWRVFRYGHGLNKSPRPLNINRFILLEKIYSMKIEKESTEWRHVHNSVNNILPPWSHIEGPIFRAKFIRDLLDCVTVKDEIVWELQHVPIGFGLCALRQNFDKNSECA